MDDTTLTPPAPSDPAAAPLPASGYRDDELVYVDPDERTVVGRVEWSRAGNPKSMAVVHKDRPADAPVAEKKDAKPAVKGGKPEKPERRRGSGRKNYPWGTYKSMKSAFRLEGKQKKMDPNKTLDDVLQKALEQPFWD